MTLFEFLFLGHLVGDFLFQTGWMAQYKVSKWLPLVVHSAVYTMIIVGASFVASTVLGPEVVLSPAGIGVIFIGHLILDKRTFVKWWVKYVQTAKGKEAGWLAIVADQIFHLLLLGLAIYL